MSTRIFSSRADESVLAFADALARQEYGLSFGQYCGTVLLDAIERTGKMPELVADELTEQKKWAAAFIKGFASREHDSRVGKLSDVEVRDLIASRYA